MAYLFQPDYVRYVCHCGSLKPISKIYLCRHCLKLRCGYCVCHEVDSHYCPNCMEYLPSAEVRLKKNKCKNCFDCPCCFQTLSTRAGHAPIRPSTVAAGEDIKATPKKVYYLSCSFCRWTSRDAGIPDQYVATGGWPEQENPNSMRINALIDYHKILASREKQGKVHPKYTSLQYEKFRLTTAMARKRAGRSPLPRPQAQQNDQPQPAVASENVEELPPEIFTEPLDVTKVTTLAQRLQHPDVQAERINELRPRYKQFLVKRSQRCRVCEHNVSKPEFNPQSVKFKIQLTAFYHMPEIRIVTCEPLRVGKSSELLLKLCNPTQHQTEVTLLPLDSSTTVAAQSTAREKEEGCESPSLLPSVVRQVSVTEDPKTIKVVPGADIVLPQSAIILPPRDDAAEYDDIGDTHNFQDDPKLVVWRKGNKVVIRLHVTPVAGEEIKEGDPVHVGFVMQHGYVNIITSLEQNKTPQKLDLRVRLFLTIGNLVGTV